MRNLVLSVIVLALLAAVGCDGANPGKPSSITPEQISEMERVQQQVDAAERQQRKAKP